MAVSYEEAAKELRRLFKAQFDLQEDLDRLSDKESSAETDERTLAYQRQITETKKQIRSYLSDELMRYPPHHYAEHAAALKQFHDVAAYDDSVFIMTKFPETTDDPDRATAEDKALLRVITAVQDGIRAANKVPRLATFGYEEMLWPNVELYLLGCARGVAIVEDRVRRELNPNVALEWGWMKGMGKRVFFLVEESFVHKRADWQGLLSKSFAWDTPEAKIKSAIVDWLTAKEKV